MKDRRRLLIAGSSALAVPFLPGRRALSSEFSNGYARGDAVQLYFVQSGEGPLLLFLHGHPDNGAVYQGQLQEFSRDHFVVAPNLRGYAPSDAPQSVEAYAMPHLLEDVHGVLDHFGREPCILIGHDWGGYVSWVFASAYPERVQRLIILNAPHPAIFLREVRTNPAQIGASQYERAFHTAVPPYPVWYNYYRADPIKIPASVREASATAMPDLAAHFFAGVRRPPETKSLRLSVPTLVIWGLGDPTILPGCIRGLEEYVQNLTMVRIENAGHYPMQSHADVVNRAIKDFIRQ
jgi:epoxide hydrolase 4